MKEFLESTGLLSSAEIEETMAHTKRLHFKKGDYLIREGEVCKQAGYVQTGCFRSFYHSSGREETTYCFRFAGSFVAAYSSFLTGEPTAECIQATMDSEILSLSKDYIIKLQEENRSWLKLMKELAEKEFIEMEKRIFVLQKESAEKRYENLLNNHPEYLQHIPLNYLASYLGITQRHLSRIRGSYLV